MKTKIHFTHKALVIAIVTLFIVSSISALNIQSQDNTFLPSDISRNSVWNVTLLFTETGGGNDYIIFGESSNATDGVDVFYDKPNPPSGPEPFLDAYFTTSFPYPYDALLQEIKKYPDTYKEWNFTVWWTGTDTTVTITWNTIDVNKSEYDTIMLFDSTGTLTDMSTSNNFAFFCPGPGLISFQIIATANRPPIPTDQYPANGSTGVERPPDELNVTVEDPDGDAMDVYIMWKNHTGDWIALQTYPSVGNGSYNFIPPEENDWIWGNTTYVWSVNTTDPSGSGGWTNETYQYTTKGSRYDVNNNGRVNFQDAGLVWIHRTSEVNYDPLYDVNQDGEVNFQDAGLTWVNRD